MFIKTSVYCLELTEYVRKAFFLLSHDFFSDKKELEINLLFARFIEEKWFESRVNFNCDGSEKCSTHSTAKFPQTTLRSRSKNRRKKRIFDRSTVKRNDFSFF